MGWGGASGLQAIVAIFFFTGPVLLLLSSIFLWIQAQFFPVIVRTLYPEQCCTFLTWNPVNQVLRSAVSSTSSVSPSAYPAPRGFALSTSWQFTMRINLLLAGIFGFVTLRLWILSGAYWAPSNRHFKKALRLQKLIQI